MRHPRSRASDQSGTGALGPGAAFLTAESDRDVIGLAYRTGLCDQVSALRRQADGRKCALADDHGMHELDRDVPSIGASDGRRAERDQAAAAREALRHAVAAACDGLGLRVEERLVRLGPDPGQLVEALCERGCWRAQATASARLRDAGEPLAELAYALAGLRGDQHCPWRRG